MIRAFHSQIISTQLLQLSHMHRPLKPWKKHPIIRIRVDGVRKYQTAGSECGERGRTTLDLTTQEQLIFPLESQLDSPDPSSILLPEQVFGYQIKIEGNTRHNKPRDHSDKLRKLGTSRVVPLLEKWYGHRHW